jgi:hypothetical protein
MQTPKSLREESGKRLANAKDLHADADAAQQRSTERKQGAERAKATMERLRDPTWRMRHETELEMAERHVAEADRHVEHQKRLIEVLIRDRHERMLVHARKVLEVLEQSRRLARTHLALEREFQGNLM